MVGGGEMVGVGEFLVILLDWVRGGGNNSTTGAS